MISGHLQKVVDNSSGQDGRGVFEYYNVNVIAAYGTALFSRLNSWMFVLKVKR